MARDKCAWCSEESISDTSIGKGRKLKLIPVCPTHLEMVNREFGEREREAQKKKEPFVPWW